MINNISVVITTKNGEKTIINTINSVKFLNEIIVVIDSSTSDNTYGLINATNLKNLGVYEKKFDNFSNQKNYGISKAVSDYILILDDDEIVSDELAYFLQNEKLCKEGYSIAFREYMRRKWTDNGQRGSRHIRLIKKGNLYHGSIHERFNIDSNKVYKVSAKYCINHYSHISINKTLTKFNYYTEIEIEELKSLKLGYAIILLIFMPIKQFIIKFFLRKGFLEGINGFISAVFRGIYEFIKYSKIIESKIKNK